MEKSFIVDKKGIQLDSFQTIDKVDGLFFVI